MNETAQAGLGFSHFVAQMDAVGRTQLKADRKKYKLEAEADNAWAYGRDQEAIERLVQNARRDWRAGGPQGLALPKVQVGDDERRASGPPQRPPREQDQALTAGLDLDSFAHAGA